jgi:predicted peptidase
MKRTDFTKTSKSDLGYIIYTPAKLKKNLPLIVFLHGAGERGNGTTDLERVNVHGVSHYCNDGTFELDAVVLCPQCPEGTVWNKMTVELKALIDKVAAKYHVNTKKISLTGLSMGGFGTWEMALTYPEYFSCFAPICGGGMAWRCGEALKGKPIWAFHGNDDPVVAFSNSVEMVDKARAAGANIKFTIFDKVGHLSWVPAYVDTTVINWLLSHSL